MHCVDPACATACPVKALEKTKAGPVIYHSEICIGCRYCMAACPFDIPKYQWDKVFPLIQKCDFCADRQAAGLLPACAEACTNGALIYGKRSELIKVARERIKTNPETYVNHIYGEYEVGGTSNLYISNVAFDKLGFPNLNTTALPELTWPWMSAVPGVFVGMAGLMTGIYFITKRKGENNKEEK
jgi:formate dehydrogenase iron-sulfur subunit